MNKYVGDALKLARENNYKARIYSNGVCVSKNGFGIQRKVTIGQVSLVILADAINDFHKEHK